jgi:hypothetical protein
MGTAITITMITIMGVEGTTTAALTITNMVGASIGTAQWDR